MHNRHADQDIEEKSHTPDCSQVTDFHLSKSIFSRWPQNENNVTHIPYGYSYLPLVSSPGILINLLLMKIYHTKRVSLAEPSERIKKIIHTALKKWERASNNTIKFFQINDVSIYSHGIFFYLAGTISEFLKAYQASGVALMLLNNHYLLRKAFLLFPEEKNFWDTSDFHSIRTVSHEIGHSLGLLHLHEDESTRLALRQTADAGFCSVMPYVKEILSPISNCYRNCWPSFAIYPGDLDSRMMMLAYSKDVYKIENLFPYTVINLGEVFLTSALLSISHTTLKEMLMKLFFIKNHIATLFADLSMVIILIELGAPDWLTNIFSILFAMKCLASKKLTLLDFLKIPQTIERIAQFETLNVCLGLYIVRDSLSPIKLGCGSLDFMTLLISYLGDSMGRAIIDGPILKWPTILTNINSINDKNTKQNHKKLIPPITSRNRFFKYKKQPTPNPCEQLTIWLKRFVS